MRLLRTVGAAAALVALGCVCVASAAAAVDMKWIGTVGNANLGGVYVDPYNLSIGGVSTYALCDDFTDHVAPPNEWQANVYTYADLVGGATTRMETLGQLQDPLTSYRAAYYLATRLLTTPVPDDATRGELSFALWALMEPNQNILATLGTGTAAYQQAGAYMTRALAWANDAGKTADLSGLRIYSPIPIPAGKPYAGEYAQEFLAIQAPEPPAPAILAVELTGALAIVWAFRRRIKARVRA